MPISLKFYQTKVFDSNTANSLIKQKMRYWCHYNSCMQDWIAKTINMFLVWISCLYFVEKKIVVQPHAPEIVEETHNN